MRIQVKLMFDDGTVIQQCTVPVVAGGEYQQQLAIPAVEKGIICGGYTIHADSWPDTQQNAKELMLEKRGVIRSPNVDGR